MSTPTPLAAAPRDILAATDLSSPARGAVAWAQEIAIDQGCSLHLVLASNLAGWSTDYLEFDARIPLQVQEANRRKLEALAVEFGRPELPITTEVRTGDPCEVILATATERGADLIVIGTRGERGFDHLLLGSTAERVVQRAACPVLTIHPQAAENPRPIRRILVATDFSAEADVALQTSLSLSGAEPAQLQVILLHAYVVPYELLDSGGFVSTATGLEQWQTAQRDVERRLTTAAAALLAAGAHVETLGVEGYPPEVIIERAIEYEIDLIAMGTHGRTGLSHVLLGSTAERVIHKAPCPVLTVRRGVRSAAAGESQEGSRAV